MLTPEDLGAPVADALLAHTPQGTVHAARPATPYYVVSLPDEVASTPAVRLFLHHCATRRGEYYEVPADLAAPFVDAIASGDNNRLAALAVGAIKNEENTQ